MARFASILSQIVEQLTGWHSVLELGCGDGNHFSLYSSDDTCVIALDIDFASLRCAVRQFPRVYTLQADITRLPLRGQFDLIVVRHPDVNLRHADWKQAFLALPDWLNDGGIALITAYSFPEVEIIRGWLSHTNLSPLPVATHKLAPPGLAGRDRFALVYRKSP